MVWRPGARFRGNRGSQQEAVITPPRNNRKSRVRHRETYTRASWRGSAIIDTYANNPALDHDHSA